jgi:hypothetical protein
MRLPHQSSPVTRGVSASPVRGSIASSGEPECSICMLACNELNGIAKMLCQEACRRTVC